ncbi:MAG: lipopolysaccharide biosynthesis protein [Bacteroides sp.]|nr:lipopolysaccharide biosynthesis protein [Bacteroides sp.]
MERLRDTVIKGAFWSTIERFGYLGIQFLANLIMARILSPTDFGIIGILLIFISLANVLADSGLASALVQRKNISSVDCNTIFLTNLFIGIALYVLLFLSTPWISTFFNHENLSSYLRAIGVVIILDAISSIQNALLIKNLDFKTIAILRILSIIGACTISIYLAFKNWGIWALVIQYIIYSFLRSILLYYFSSWRPKFEYSFKSFSSLFNYGAKLMLSTFIADIYLNFQSLLIGKFLNPKILGFYTQAKQLQQVPVTALTSIINQVSFPAFAKIQEDKSRFIHAFKNNIIILSFINFPLMFLLSALATPLITFLYTDKWIDAAPYFQFLCIGFGTLLVIHNTNLTALKALGKSGVVLKLEILKKLLGIVLLILGIWLYGIWGIMLALTINSIIEIFLNGYYINKYIEITPFQQLKWLSPFLIFSTISFFITLFLIRLLSWSNIILIFLGIILFISSYGIMVYTFAPHIFQNILLPLLKKVKLS